ncbi:MAG: IS1634 family transposase [Bdellovibrionaceae bacterium]|nr:IS1634 family transposase [Pseudobdellovibrionaceae bacterium]MCB9025267.1 IS1634 family transposase [Pseudobdellovibrionaceae bacterium]MCB9026313.1 IS1634 family transposase [Pseudobdellovibrionaceae bacterium]
MFVKKVKRADGKTSVLIAQSVRNGSKVTHKTVRSLGTVQNESELAIILKSATEIIAHLKEKDQPLLSGLDPVEFYTKPTLDRQKIPDIKVNLSSLQEEARLICGSQEVFGQVYTQMKFDNILQTNYKPDNWNQVLKQAVLSRILNPVSKLKTSEQLVDYHGINISVSTLYRMMDKVFENKEHIKDIVLKNSLELLDHEIDVTFFDVTTLHFESFNEDDLRRFGFSKNCRFKETQVVLALQTARGGIPVGYELYPGNTYEGSTLIDAVKNHKEKFNLKKVVLVADRAMFNRNNLNKMDELGVEYVVAAKLKTLPAQVKNEILEFSKNNTKKEYLVMESSYEQRRLIVNYSPDRANKDTKDRERLVARLKKQLEEGEKIKVTKLIKNQGTKKYLKVNTDKVSAVLNEDKIQSDSLWDGLHGIITNVKDSSSKDLIDRYKDLWQIEEAFRINKTDLKMRPIFHWKKQRIEAHIAICYLAFSVIVQIRENLKRAGIKLSVDKIRYQLTRVQKSIMFDPESKRRFVIPSKLNPIQQGIYQALGIKHQESVYFI